MPMLARLCGSEGACALPAGFWLMLMPMMELVMINFDEYARVKKPLLNEGFYVASF